MVSVTVQETIINASIDAQGVTAATTDVLSIVVVASDTLATTSAEAVQTTGVQYTTSTVISNTVTPTTSIGASLEVTAESTSVVTAGPVSTGVSSSVTSRGTSSTARGGSPTMTTGEPTSLRASLSAPGELRSSTSVKASAASSARTPTFLPASQGGSIDAIGGAGIGIACTILFLCLIGAMVLYAQRRRRMRRDRMSQQKELLDAELNSEPQHDNHPATWKETYLAYYHDLSARDELHELDNRISRVPPAQLRPERYSSRDKRERSSKTFELPSRQSHHG